MSLHYAPIALLIAYIQIRIILDKIFIDYSSDVSIVHQYVCIEEKSPLFKCGYLSVILWAKVPITPSWLVEAYKLGEISELCIKGEGYVLTSQNDAAIDLLYTL